MTTPTELDVNIAWLTGRGVPSEIARAALDAPDESQAITDLKAALNGGATLVVLTGAVGAGKSVAAAWWLGRAIALHGRVWALWVHAHQLGRLSGYESRDEVEAVEDADFLVIDDLGVEYLDGKGWLAAMLDSIVYQRHGNRRLTVLTTNLKAGDFRARYGERVADRIRECGVFLEVAGESRRRRPEVIRDALARASERMAGAGE